MKILIILLISISQCLAIDVTPIQKGEKAPANGFFLDTPNMKEVRQINEEKKVLKKENVTLKDLNSINESRVDTYRKLSEESEKALSWERTKGNGKGIVGFVVGVIATSVAAYAAIRVSK